MTLDGDVDYEAIRARRRARAQRLLVPILVFVGSTLLSLTLMMQTQNPAFVFIAFAGAAWMTVALVREVRLMLSPPSTSSATPSQPNIVE